MNDSRYERSHEAPEVDRDAVNQCRDHRTTAVVSWYIKHVRGLEITENVQFPRVHSASSLVEITPTDRAVVADRRTSLSDRPT